MTGQSQAAGGARGLAAVLTRIIAKKRTVLLQRGGPILLCGRAVPLNFFDPLPLQAALARNIEAALAGRPCPCCT